MLGYNISTDELAEALLATTKDVEEVYIDLGGDYSIFEENQEQIEQDLAEYVYVCEDCTQWVDTNLGCEDCT